MNKCLKELNTASKKRASDDDESVNAVELMNEIEEMDFSKMDFTSKGVDC